jgi:hypothetical protein
VRHGDRFVTRVGIKTRSGSASWLPESRWHRNPHGDRLCAGVYRAARVRSEPAWRRSAKVSSKVSTLPAGEISGEFVAGWACVEMVSPPSGEATGVG